MPPPYPVFPSGGTRREAREILGVQKNSHFYAEIVKFGLILTQVKLFGGQENIFGKKAPPHVPPLLIFPISETNTNMNPIR